MLDDALAFYREILAREKVTTPERIVSDPIPVSSYLRFRKARDASGTFRVVTPHEIVEDRRVTGQVDAATRSRRRGAK